MAYTEKLLPVEALMAAWQNNRQNSLRDDSAAKERESIQNDLLKEQLAAAKWQNMVSKERPTITLPAGPGLGGMREKQFLDQQAGYISGTNPADVFNQWQQNFRQGMTAGGGGGGRGGYGGGGGGEGQGEATTTAEGGGKVSVQSGDLGYYGPDHSKAPDVATAASRLAELYQGAPQADLSNPNELQNALVDERGNISGVKSLIDQAYGKGVKAPGMAEDYILGGSSPIATEVGKQNAAREAEKNTYLLTGNAGDVPKGLTPQEEFSLKEKRTKSEQDLKTKNQQALQKEAEAKSREYELRKLSAAKLAEDGTYRIARPDTQQAILDLAINDREKLLGELKKWPGPEKNELLRNLPAIVEKYKNGGKLNWEAILNPEKWKAK